jgi:polar amino acid transport system substrate-binding protein
MTLGAFAAPMKLVTEEYPPLNFQTPSGVSGLSVDILSEAMKRAKQTFDITIFPWARALKMAQDDSDTCVFSTIRIPEREKLFKWIGPVVTDKLALFGLSERKFTLKSLAEAKKFHIGTYVGSGAIDYLKSQGVSLDIVSKDDQNLNKLEIGRIDLWVASTQTGSYLARNAGVAKKVDLVLVLDFQIKMYLACNKNVANSLVKKLNAIIKQMSTDGTIRRISRKYK